MLTIAEEVLLLVLDDETGQFSAALPAHALRHAVPGAILMELALRDRIDTDLKQLMVIDPSPTGEPVLDQVLAVIAGEDSNHPISHWVDLISADYEALEPMLLERLVRRGVLERRDERLLWVFGVRRYPTVDGRPLRDVKHRIMDVLLSDEIPDPRDIAIICLADVCDLWSSLILDRELRRLEPRIAQVARLDLIGQSVTQTLRELHEATAVAVARWIG